MGSTTWDERTWIHVGGVFILPAGRVTEAAAGRFAVVRGSAVVGRSPYALYLVVHGGHGADGVALQPLVSVMWTQLGVTSRAIVEVHPRHAACRHVSARHVLAARRVVVAGRFCFAEHGLCAAIHTVMRLSDGGCQQQIKTISSNKGKRELSKNTPGLRVFPILHCNKKSEALPFGFAQQYISTHCGVPSNINQRLQLFLYCSLLVEYTNIFITNIFIKLHQEMTI